MNTPGSPTQKEAPAAVLPAKGAGLGLSLNFEAAIISAPATSRQARKPCRRRKSKRQQLDAQWRGLLRQLRQLLCRSVKRHALVGTAATLDEVSTALAALIAEERDAATRRKARK
jgi:hypothetical protein